MLILYHEFFLVSKMKDNDKDLAEKLISVARTFKGTKFMHQGRSSRGLDCAGLVSVSFREAGLLKFDCGAYSRDPVEFKLVETLTENVGDAIYNVEDVQTGDILVFKIDTVYPCHLALKTETGMIHSYAVARKVVEHDFDFVWKSRFYCAIRPHSLQKTLINNESGENK